MQSKNLKDRFFPFHLLKDDKHDYSRLKTAFPNEKFKQVVQILLRDNCVAEPGTQEFHQFHRLCDIFEFMYVEKCFKNVWNDSCLS
jgi:hypothetical protein